MDVSSAARFRTGIIAISVVFVLAISLFLINNKQESFDKSLYVFAEFKNINGLEVGNDVNYAGVKVGSIYDITILNDTLVRVALGLDKEIRPFLKSDAIASVATVGLMGDKCIQIIPGSTNAPLLPERGRLQASGNPAKVDSVMIKINHLTANFQSISDGLLRLGDQFQNGHNSLQILMKKGKKPKKSINTSP